MNCLLYNYELFSTDFLWSFFHQKVDPPPHYTFDQMTRNLFIQDWHSDLLKSSSCLNYCIFTNSFEFEDFTSSNYLANYPALTKVLLLPPEFCNEICTIYVWTIKKITILQKNFENVVLFQNGGQITDFYFASFWFWPKFEKPLSQRKFSMKFGSK